MALAIGLCSLAGVVWLRGGQAAVGTVIVEAETGQLTGQAGAVSVVGASDAQAVVFGRDGGPPGMRPLPAVLHGVTIEQVSPIDSIVEALDRHQRMPTTRIVFQEGTNASNYATAINRIQSVSYIMGEILDSEGVANTTVTAYTNRAESFVSAYKDKVDIWEIGNEVNGEWLVKAPQGEAQQQEVADKIVAAYDVVEGRGLRSALTLSYFPTSDCRANDWEDMNWWAENRLPARLKTGLDYVLVSWYEESCSPRMRPSVAEWNTVFARLRQIFPDSKLGFGEIGTMNAGTGGERQAVADYYYGLSLPGQITTSGYVGGYFWWYYFQEAVPYNRSGSVWPVIEAAFNRY